MKPLTLRKASRIAWKARWQAVAAVMLPVYFLTSLAPSGWASTTDNDFPAPVLTPKNIRVNKTLPKIPSYSGVHVPSSPTNSEITYSHAFQEPLLAAGTNTSSTENHALSAAIKKFIQRDDDENVSALTNFIEQYPDSAWRPSLELNLAEILYKTGSFSKALEAWEDAWNRTQNLKDVDAKKIADLALGKLAEMKARIGRTVELDALYQKIRGRDVSGVAAQLLVQARSGLWLMHNKPQDAFRCGPSALQELALATNRKIAHPEIIKQSKSTSQGIALSDVQDLAGKINMPMQMAKRTTGSMFVVPSVIHWKLGHYAALIGKHDGKYIIHDTTFGGSQFLISEKTLEQETSGYFLISPGVLPKGWTAVDKTEGKKIFGRGNPGQLDGFAYTPLEGVSGGGDCGGTYSIAPDSAALDRAIDAERAREDRAINYAQFNRQLMARMAVSTVKAMLVSLSLSDTPIGYAPPVGPSMNFTVRYNQREIAQPLTFSYANLGPNWNFSYLSYITPGSSSANIYVRGGGVERYFYNPSINGFDPNSVSQAVLSQVNSTTWQRSLPDGSFESYAQPDGSGNIFLSKITDAQNNSLNLTYDINFRLVSILDAIGQVTIISYVSDTLGKAGFYCISKVTDPFGRSAKFSYDANGRLSQITDVIGITSQFTYSGNGTFVNSLTTPYGVTTFAFGDNSTDTKIGAVRWLNTTYPDGYTTRTEYNDNVQTIPNADPNGIPYGVFIGSDYPSGGINAQMQNRNTFYWDKQAMKTYPGDYTKAQITHWLYTSDINTTSDIEESIEKVGENRVWFAYSGAISSIQGGNSMLALPTRKARVLGTGTSSPSNSQVYSYQYNPIGKITQEVDPLGRETDCVYAANSIDLLQVKQKNGAAADLLYSATYNNQHEPLTETDASGQTTIYTYNTLGKLATVTNAKGEKTTYKYDANNYLVSVIGPVAGATAYFHYDGFGRIQTVTDSQGYSTTTNYDALDRPTLVNYPDGTASQTVYKNLDVQYTKDRLGRVTRYFYNSLRQPVEVMDAQDHFAISNWTPSAGLSSIVDSSGNTTFWKYDASNRPIEKDYPDATKQIIAYESTTSRVLSRTDNIGQVATNTYNMDNTVAMVVYTNATVATPTLYFGYDTTYPRVKTLNVGTDGTNTLTYNYNPVTGTIGSNLLGSTQTPLATISYTYDELGRQLSQTVNDSATGQGLTNSLSSVTYDTLGRLYTATTPMSATVFQYTYLKNTGRVASVTYPNRQSTVYTYQDSTAPGEPRLSEILNKNASSAVISKFDYVYDAQGQITSWTQQTGTSNGQKWSNSYDAEGKLTGVNITDAVTMAVLHQYVYLYDAVGNRTSEQVDSSVTASSYNNLNQITGQSSGGQMVFSGTLSEPSLVTVAGNAANVNYSTNFLGVASVTNGINYVPVIAQDVNGNAKTNSYKVTIPTGAGNSYSYDWNGNLTSDGVRTYGWDAKNQLVSIIYNSGPNAGTHTEFTYNGAGQRIKVVERSGTAIGSGTVSSTKQYFGGEERDVNNKVTKRYFTQGEQRISGATATNYFYTDDHLGSVREVIANDGSTVSSRYSYDPFGRATLVSGSLACDFQYAGMYMHSTSGLNLTACRAYNSNVGRWISRDPTGETSGLNLYAYCGDGPVNLCDPTGLCAGSGGTGGLTAQIQAAQDAILKAAAQGVFDAQLAILLATGIPEEYALADASIAASGSSAGVAAFEKAGAAEARESVSAYIADLKDVGTRNAAEGDTYEILNGVHRAKAAQVSGMDTIPADVNGTITDIPINKLLAPHSRSEIDLTDPDDMDYFLNQIMPKVQDGTAEPIVVTPGSNGIPIPNVPIKR